MREEITVSEKRTYICEHCGFKSTLIWSKCPECGQTF